MVVFTGSTATGKKIAEVAGRDAKKLSFEMGGKNPLIIFDDANLEDALAGALRGGYTHAGQVCIATGRILVHEKIYDEFLKKLVERASKRKVGYQLDTNTEMGPLINKNRIDAVSGYVEEARENGLKILCGGKRLSKNEVGYEGYYYAPTVIADVTPNDRIAKEEIFGPVLPVMRFSTLDEAIEIANSLPYGLSSAVYTQSMEKAFRCIERLDSGGVSINDPTAIRADQAPFGGFKSSGLGREGLKYAIEEMTEIKMIYWKKY
jgi:acyl-CoA reductase-like NAD-dependent aldehyde dehydrogenase